MKPVSSADNLVSNNTYAHKTAKKSAEQKITENNIKNSNNNSKETGSALNVKKSNDPADGGVYSRRAAHKERLAQVAPQIDMIRQQSAEQLVQMLYDVLNMQGRQGFVARGQLEDAIMGLKHQLENGGTVTPQEQAAAAAAIADGGPWSVEAVSDRLVNMAVSFAGGDESKFAMMRSAIEAGFKMAEAMWGGQLPDISYRTFEATMTKLAEAFGQNAPAAETEAG
jgi:hypothetical protein